MKDARVHSPGKLMLGGEYAVLLPGGKGICLAVGPGIEAELHWGGAADTVHLTLPDGAHILRFGEGIWRMEVPRPGPRFVLAALQEMLPRGIAPGFFLHLSQAGWESQRPAGRTKAGLGGSAAATVATVAVVGQAMDRGDTPRVWLDGARAAHHRAQGGKGSGIDVYTSGLGGVVVMETRDGEPHIHRLTWPAPWELLVGVSPTSVSTPERIQVVQQHFLEDPTFTRHWLQHSNLAVEGLAEAIHTGNYPRMVEGLRQTGEVLRDLGNRCQMEMEDPLLARMAELARPWGTTRPSGAGGGDCGLALGFTPSHTPPLRRVLEQEGVELLTIQPGVEGPLGEDLNG